MTEGNSQPDLELRGLLQRLQTARAGLMEAIGALDPDSFTAEVADGASVKRALERTVDDLNFYYGTLVARALSLPQPPCLQRADFSSLREATMSLQVAHRRFSNLLHDLIPSDLEKVAIDPQHGTYTLRQILELATAQYSLRTQQLQHIAAQTARRS